MSDTARAYDATGIQLPVQWCFKSRLADGRTVDIILRRVKAGNETPIDVLHESENFLHLKGKFSDAQTLFAHVNDAALGECQREWIAAAMQGVMAQLLRIARAKPVLLELFVPKGKMEIYQPEARRFAAQYIHGNYTLKLHAAALNENDLTLAHLIAQHLDYPFGSGERRFSTSRLFDLCFTAEKVIAPKGLAAHIDAELQQRGVYCPHKHSESDAQRVAALLDGHSATIRTSYERVLQRERFAAMIVAHHIATVHGIKSSLLGHYQSLVDIDLLAQKQNDYKDYPSKGMDQMATAIHVPLITILKAGRHDTGNTARYG